MILKRWGVTQMNDKCEDILIETFDTFTEAWQFLLREYPHLYLMETNKYRRIYQTDYCSNVYVSIWDRKELSNAHCHWSRKYRQPDC